jgi:hypothetical protein
LHTQSWICIHRTTSAAFPQLCCGIQVKLELVGLRVFSGNSHHECTLLFHVGNWNGNRLDIENSEAQKISMIFFLREKISRKSLCLFFLREKISRKFLCLFLLREKIFTCLTWWW